MGAYPKKTFINMIRAAENVHEVFVASRKQLAHKKDGDPYLIIDLMDRSGHMKAVAWDNVKTMNEAFAAGDYIEVKGNVVEYREALQVVVQKIDRIDPADVDARDFLPATERDVDQMLDRLVLMTQGVKNPYLSKLLAAFFGDEAFVDRFRAAPAAKRMHHAYLGGLLEHTLSIARLIRAVADHYKGIDSDLLLAGGILHDIGKVHEFSYETHIDYSDAGRLLNHIVIGVEMLEKKIAGIEGFPENLALLLKHMIVSHHGTRDFGSPEPPKTLEAVILYYLDELDAKVTAVRAFMEADNSDDSWTSYHGVLDRFFFKGKPDNPAPEGE